MNAVEQDEAARELAASMYADGYENPEVARHYAVFVGKVRDTDGVPNRTPFWDFAVDCFERGQRDARTGNDRLADDNVADAVLSAREDA